METFEGDEYIHYFYHGGGFTSMWHMLKFIKSYSLNMYFIVYLLYLHKAFKEKDGKFEETEERKLLSACLYQVDLIQ